ncbi:hypothetical protein RRG08_066800 [Elysia crispata]|uniref:ILCR1 Ig-like domain-containing protein n=1 Tax=Elysia crispata TaxID=231223 RepID=A0AAE1CUK2_9GAST|nr:hypothetical protein RRG08_066800 [Elysia crispata]
MKILGIKKLHYDWLLAIGMALKHFLKRKKISVMIFCYVLLSSYVCVHFAFCASDPCTLKVFEEQSGDRIEDLCLEEYKDPDCLPFVEHFNRLELPTGFSLTDDDDPVQRPESLDVTFSFEQDKDNGNEALVLRIYVDWSSPFDRFSRENTKGYLLIGQDTRGVMCRLFKFDANKTDLLGKKLRFQYKIQDLESLLSIAVKVYSMPPPKKLEESEKKTTFMSLDLTTGSISIDTPGEWMPSLSTRFIKEDAIEVKFGYPPSRLNLTHIEAHLFKSRYDKSKSNLIKKISYTLPDSQDSQGMFSFTKLEENEYRIEIHVIDPFLEQFGKCLCWSTSFEEAYYCASRCGYNLSNMYKVSFDETLVPGKWIPTWNTRVLKEGAIDVKIGHSPSRFNLTQFKVSLMKRTSFENSTFKTIFYTEPPDSLEPTGLVSFTNLDYDEYKIMIQVIDPFHKQAGKCLCWVKGANGRHCRNSCGSVATDWIEVSVDDPGKWIPPWNTRVLKGGAIEVKIGHSPSRFNLTQFKVSLMKGTSFEKSAFKTIFYTEPPGSLKPAGLVSFTNLNNDEYKIVIQVIDPFHKQAGKCLCWVKGANGRHCRNSCGSVATDWIEVSVDDPGKWIPPLNTRVLKEGAIEVKIGHSPSRFNFTQFKVMLIKGTSFEKSAFKTIFYTEPSDSLKPAGLVSFTNLDNDEYKIVIQVIDPFLKQIGKCLCWVRGTNGRHCKNSCGSVATDWMELSIDVPGKWIPPLNTRVLKEGAIEVKIGHSPSRFNLTQFAVILKKRALSENSAFETIFYTEPPDSRKPAGSVSFANLENGEYKIVVEVIDPFRKQVGKCLCWIKGTNGRHCKKRCGVVSSDWIKVPIDVPEDPKAERSRNSSPAELNKGIMITALLTLQNVMLLAGSP